MPQTTILSRPLSDRQMQVLELKAGGLTYLEIGRMLGITGRTAMQHAVHAREKLQAGTMLEAVVMAVKLGLVSDDRKGDFDGREKVA